MVNSDSNVKLSVHSSKSPSKRFKSYTLGVIFFLIMIGCIFFIGTIGSDFFALLIFLIIISIPLLILFRKHLYDLLPDFLSNNLLEIDNIEKNDKLKLEFRISLWGKEAGIYGTIIMLCITAAILLLDFRTKIEEKKTIVKILGGVICIVLSGMLLTDIDNLTKPSV